MMCNLLTLLRVCFQKVSGIPKEFVILSNYEGFVLTVQLKIDGEFEQFCMFQALFWIIAV